MIPRHPRSTLFPYTTLFRSSLTPVFAHPCNRLSVTKPDILVIESTPSAWRPEGGENTCGPARQYKGGRSEEHTSELQSPYDLVCRLLLEKKNKKKKLIEIT